MAIKIIKEGKPENYKFRVTCPICGCVFEYELCDLVKKYSTGIIYTTYPAQYGYTRYVECPCCHEQVIHDSGCDFGNHDDEFIYTNDKTGVKLTEEEIKNREFYVDYQNPGVVWNGGISGELDCEKCPNKPDFKDGTPIAGDTPCTWCPKMQPKC